MGCRPVGLLIKLNTRCSWKKLTHVKEWRCDLRRGLFVRRVLLQNEEEASPLPGTHVAKTCVKKKPQARYALGALQLLPQLRLLGRATGVGGPPGRPTKNQIRNAFGGRNPDHAVVLPAWRGRLPQRFRCRNTPPLFRSEFPKFRTMVHSTLGGGIARGLGSIRRTSTFLGRPCRAALRRSFGLLVTGSCFCSTLPTAGGLP